MDGLFLHGLSLSPGGGGPVSQSIETLWTGNVSTVTTVTLSDTLAIGDILFLEHGDTLNTTTSPIILLSVANNKEYWFAFGATGITGVRLKTDGTQLEIHELVPDYNLIGIHRLNIS